MSISKSLIMAGAFMSTPAGARVASVYKTYGLNMTVKDIPANLADNPTDILVPVAAGVIYSKALSYLGVKSPF